MNKDIVIGVLAYNVDPYIEDIVKDLSPLGLDFLIINDCSTDETQSKLLNLQEKFNFKLINNEKNMGAGKSTKILIKHAFDNGYKFFIKVDGDGQFEFSDIQKIINLYNDSEYDFIKSNRFWEGGIIGKIPKKRLFGNLFATMLLQLTTGTNKIYDPLNGLFGVNTKVIKHLNKNYPVRYGYPFYISVVAIINSYKTYQINNTVIYGDQKSKLNPFKVLFTLLKLFVFFYFKKIKIKKNIGNYQRSAFFDLLFLFSLIINLYLLIQIILVINFYTPSFLNPRTLLFLFLIFTFLSMFLFTISFREEKMIRNTYISCEK